jgi:1-pyrroline-5-carboxylate dehydrogenase
MSEVNREAAVGGWTRAVTARPRLTLLLALLFTALAVIASNGVADRLSSGGWEAPDSQSSYATAALADHFPASQPNLVLLVDGRGADVDSPAVAAEGQDLARRLAADPDVAGVTSYWATHAPVLRAKDGRSAMISARLRGDDNAVAKEIKRVAPAYRGTHGPVGVRVGGSAAVRHDLQTTIQQDLVRAEMIALPITLLLLVMVFGSAVAALLPLGVGIIIPPWNFPLAILLGMTTAALVTGNTVVIKPSSDTPTIAAKFAEAMLEAGIPAKAFSLLVGSGGAIGDVLVSHPRTRFISFTGSRDVGLHINELAAKTPKGQLWIKRVIAEMGGKDAIIVDRDCDLDEAVQGVLVSAFGYQGQKCSACSRAIVDEAIYDEFLEKLKSKTEALRLGPPEKLENYMGPVINQRAKESILNYIEIGKSEGRLITGGEAAEGDGYFIKPTIIADIEPKARIFQEEIFGPVLAVTKAKDFNQALAFANDSEYGLTGAVFTRDAANIEKAKKKFFVGNLYINRKCTGAMVGAHPFGGFNMSGTDSKAGGPDYLLQFVQAKSIAEKLS